MILAIDPGSSQSAWLLFDGRPVRFAIEPNALVLDRFRGVVIGWPLNPDIAVIEWTAPRGMPASAELFETLWWAGRFAEALHPLPVERLKRGDVKRALCGTTAANDANVRAALIDRFGGTGGKAAAVGLKASPGPLFGIAKDLWAALGIAVTFAESRP